MAEQGSPSGQETQALAAPELKLKVTSEASVVSPEKARRADGVVLRPTQEGVLLLAQGEPIKTLTKDAHLVETFKGDPVVFDWERYRETSNLREETVTITLPNQTRQMGEFPTDWLPSEIRPAIEAKIRATGTAIEMPTEPWRVDTSDLKNVTALEARSSILLKQHDGEGFIAYQTTDAAGTPQEPQNWTRHDTLTAATSPLPADIRAQINVLDTGAIGVYKGEANLLTVVKSDGLQVRTGAGVTTEDRMPGIGGNVTESRGMVYYCQGEGAAGRGVNVIKTMDTTKNPVQIVSHTLPEEYGHIRNLRLDSTGNVLTFSSDKGFIMLPADDLSREPIVQDASIQQGIISEDNKIYGLDSSGKLTIHEVDLTALTQSLQKKRLEEASANAAGALKTPDQRAAEEAAARETQFEHLRPVRDTNIATLMTHLAQYETVAEIARYGTDDARTLIDAVTGLTPEERMYMMQGLNQAIRERQEALATPVVETALEGLRTVMNQQEEPMDLTRFREARDLQREIEANISFITNEQTRTEYQALATQLQEQSQTFEQAEGTRIMREATSLLQSVSRRIGELGTLANLNDWRDHQRHVIEAQLRELREDALTDDVKRKIDETLAAIQKQVSLRSSELRKESRIGRTSEVDALVELRSNQIDDFMDRLRDSSFITSDQVLGLLGSGQYTEIEEGLTEMINRYPSEAHQARELRRKLKSSIALYVDELERDKAGEEEGMVSIGGELFPIFEKPRSQRDEKRDIALTYIRDKNKGTYDVAVKITTSKSVKKNGKTTIERSEEVRPVYAEGDNWALGETYREAETAEVLDIDKSEYKDILNKFRAWEGGSLREEVTAKRKAVHDAFAKRPVTLADGTRTTISEVRRRLAAGEDLPRYEDGKRWNTIEDPDWAENYKEKVNAYGEFAAENHVVLFEHLDKLKTAPEVDEPNGQGSVPKWEGHWIKGPQQNEYLKEMAKLAKQQLRLKEGIINLNGHAGVGKDVLIKMFANMSNRELFTYDANKWTSTESLSEDIQLVAQDGSTQTLTIPSILINAIQTPGAILYINEFNGMPEQAQLFLHALFDKSRRLSLVTSRGSIKADPSVLFFSSMNPGYKGTFDVQPATRSRTMNMRIDYPPLRDPQNPRRFNVSEALQMARGVRSLEDFTYDQNLDRNDFVKAWNQEINHDSNNGAPSLNEEQRIDIKTIFEVVKMAAKLREEFVKTFNKGRTMDTRPLRVTQPLTARESTRIADWLGEMTRDQKLRSDPQMLAIDLLSRVYLTHFDDDTERAKIAQELPRMAQTA